MILSVRPDLETDNLLILSSSASFWLVSCFCCFINSCKTSSLENKHMKLSFRMLLSLTLFLIIMSQAWSLVSRTDVSNRLMIWCLQLSWWSHGCIFRWYLIPNSVDVVVFYHVDNCYMVTWPSSNWDWRTKIKWKYLFKIFCYFLPSSLCWAAGGLVV